MNSENFNGIVDKVDEAVALFLNGAHNGFVDMGDKKDLEQINRNFREFRQCAITLSNCFSKAAERISRIDKNVSSWYEILRDELSEKETPDGR